MNRTKRCDGVTRRDFLRIGGLTALGLGLGDFFHLRRAFATENPLTPKAKSCILIWLDGGPSHLETFDPKPEAPEEVRGPLKTIATNLTGVRISECLEQTAGIMDKLAIIRSMTSPLGEHNLAARYLMTGHLPSPTLEYPTLGATLAHVRSQNGVLPPNIAVPNLNVRDGASIGSGYLPGSTSPFSVGGDPGLPDFKVRDLDFYQGLDLRRLDRRRQFVNALDDFSRAKDAAATSVSDPDLERAYNLIASPEAKAAFDLSEEPQKVRERYGIDPRRTLPDKNNIGQCCLLARRLIERGVLFVTVNNSGWDLHQNLLRYKERYPGSPDKYGLIPALDRAFSALIEDLSDRGMLDETLVVVMGEFGRTPKINSNAGRDHWPNVFSVVLAGGGVRGGQIIGSSDALGEFPKDRPVTPSDLAATIYTLLGIDPSLELHTSDGRPVRVAPDGAKVVSELIG
ncbi:DUF1501 domain-containing protein [Candidatus Poribacteria bacterium]|nr:DUF1501 domain-containing protein [Candidatus Poribacteria bacterium]